MSRFEYIKLIVYGAVECMVRFELLALLKTMSLLSVELSIGFPDPDCRTTTLMLVGFVFFEAITLDMRVDKECATVLSQYLILTGDLGHPLDY